MINGAHAHAARFPLVQPFIKVLNLGVRTFQRHPFLVKTLTSGVGFAVGDSLTQLATRREGEPYDWPRTVAMGGAGVGVAGPLGFLLIVWMESNIMPTAPTRYVKNTKVFSTLVYASLQVHHLCCILRSFTSPFHLKHFQWVLIFFYLIFFFAVAWQ